MTPEDKKAVRATRRELKLEKRYGNPVMALITKYDPEVKPYYDRYKQYQKQAFHSMIWAFGWAAIATLLIFVAAFSADHQWGFTAVVDMMLAMYWLNSARIEEARADLVRHEFCPICEIHGYRASLRRNV